MHKGFLKAGALFAMLSVMLGAFGAHALKEIISERALATFETGVRYQFFHALALILTGVLFKEYKENILKWAGSLFIMGILLFSFSLYFLSAVQAAVQPGYRWVGLITPIGGLCFIFGWLLLFKVFFKKTQ